MSTMLAEVFTGAAPSGTVVDELNMRFNTSDTVIGSGTDGALIIPAAGTNYSYWKSYRLYCSVSPDGTANNLNFYTDGTNSSPAGVTWMGQSAGSYVQATGTPGTTGTVLSLVNHVGLDAAPVDIFTWTSAAPLSLTGEITNPSTGAWGDYVVMQIGVDASTGSGTLSQEVFTWVWDET